MAVMVGVMAATSSGQNLIGNGSFEAGVEPSPRSDCCELIESVPAGSELLSPWSLGGAGAELRGRSLDCPAGAASGLCWLRLGIGSAGGWVEQAFPTRPGSRYVCRFRRWVSAPTTATVPIQVVGPGFSVIMQIPSDGVTCEPSIAATSSVEFDAIDVDASIRFVVPGGPSFWNVMIDDVVVVPVEDCDGDGVVDGLAIADGLVPDGDGDWIPDSCECHGDIDGNGFVDGTDLAHLMGHWGLPIPSELDADGDGVAGGADIAVLLGNWGACP